MAARTHNLARVQCVAVKDSQKRPFCNPQRGSDIEGDVGEVTIVQQSSEEQSGRPSR